MRSNQQAVPVSPEEEGAVMLEDLGEVVAGVIQVHERNSEQCSLHS